MSDLEHDLPALAKRHADAEDQRRPRQRAEERVEEKLLHVHMREARRKRDERAHDGKHAAEEHRLDAILVKPTLRDIDVRLLHEEILAVLVDKGTPAVAPDEISEDRSRHAADHAGNHRPDETHAVGEDQIARKSEDQLARNRYTGILQGHQDGDRHITPGINELQKCLRELLHTPCPSSRETILQFHYTLPPAEML